MERQGGNIKKQQTTNRNSNIEHEIYTKITDNNLQC